MDYADTLTNYFLDLNNDGVTDLMTRRWSDDACRGQKIGYQQGTLLCDCSKIGFAAIDADAHLYVGGTASQTSSVSGLKYCTEDLTGDLPTYPQYVHLFGDFNGDGIVDVIETFSPQDAAGDVLPMQLQLLLGGGNQTFTKAVNGAFTIAESRTRSFKSSTRTAMARPTSWCAATTPRPSPMSCTRTRISVGSHREAVEHRGQRFAVRGGICRGRCRRGRAGRLRNDRRQRLPSPLHA